MFEIFFFILSLKKTICKEAKNPEKLFEYWKLGFPFDAQPRMDHSKFISVKVFKFSYKML